MLRIFSLAVFPEKFRSNSDCDRDFHSPTVLLHYLAKLDNLNLSQNQTYLIAFNLFYVKLECNKTEHTFI